MEADTGDMNPSSATMPMISTSTRSRRSGLRPRLTPTNYCEEAEIEDMSNQKGTRRSLRLSSRCKKVDATNVSEVQSKPSKKRKLPSKKKVQKKYRSVVESDTDDIDPNSKRVIIIGAGMAGLACARELIERNHQVLVLEGRLRPGGRINTIPLHLSLESNPETENTTNNKMYRERSSQNTSYQGDDQHVCPVDMGGALIHGIEKNPIYDLCKNVGISTTAMNREDCKLLEYRNAGWTVDVKIDNKVQRRFNDVLDKAMDMSEKILATNSAENGVSNDVHNGDSNDYKRDPDEIKRNEDSNGSNDFSRSSDDVIDAPSNVRRNKHLPIPEGADPSISFGSLFKHYASDEAMTVSNNESNGTNECSSGNYPPNSIESYLFQWHTLNLEMACGASFDNLGLAWNDDEQYSFDGAHAILKEGFGHLIERMTEGVHIQYGTEVTGIRVINMAGDTSGTQARQVNNGDNKREDNDHKVQVRTKSGQTFESDIVVCTLPLGILKENKIKFYPPLPIEKQQSISRLGYGFYNKCALSFPTIFWNSLSDFFGVIGSPVAGTSILFCNVSAVHDLPILVLIYGGSYAHEMESLTDLVVVDECMSVLRRVCGENGNIPDPVDYTVTRWGKDRFAKGAFSYVPPGVDGFKERQILSKPINYTALHDEKDTAKPKASRRRTRFSSRLKKNEVQAIGGDDGRSEDIASEANISTKEVDWSEKPAILFAGEATSLHHPSTIHGAYLSGIREAYRFDLTVDPHLNSFLQFEDTSLYKKTFSFRSLHSKNCARKDAEDDHKEVETLSIPQPTGTRKSKRNACKMKSATPDEVQSRRSRRSHKPIPINVSNSLGNGISDQRVDGSYVLAPSLVYDIALLRGMDFFGADKSGFNQIKKYMFPPPQAQSSMRDIDPPDTKSLEVKFGKLLEDQKKKSRSRRRKLNLTKWMASTQSDQWWDADNESRSTTREAVRSPPRRTGRKKTVKQFFDEIYD